MNSIPPVPGTLARVVRRRGTDMYPFYKEPPCPWQGAEAVVVEALGHGHGHVVDWVRENNNNNNA